MLCRDSPVSAGIYYLFFYFFEPGRWMSVKLHCVALLYVLFNIELIAA